MGIRTAAAVLVLSLSTVAQTKPASASAPPSNGAAASRDAQELAATLDRTLGNDGGWWNEIPMPEKDAFIDGYVTAMARANALTAGLCQSRMKEEAQPGAANFNEKLYGGMDLCLVAEELAFKVEKPLRPMLDEFYKDPLNAFIPVQNAMGYVRDQAAGRRTAGQLLDELNEWRAIVNGGARR